jgi:hypothetical protein
MIEIRATPGCGPGRRRSARTQTALLLILAAGVPVLAPSLFILFRVCKPRPDTLTVSTHDSRARAGASTDKST